MKRTHRYLSLILAGLLLLALLSGCADQPTTTDPDPTPATTTDDTAQPDPTPADEPDTEPEPDAEPEADPATEPQDEPQALLPIATDEPTISIWAAYTNQYYEDGYNQTNVPDWVYELTGVHVNFNCVSSATATEQFNLMMVGGVTDDLIAGMHNYYTMGEEYAVDEGLIVNMTDYVQQYMPNYQAAQAWSEDHHRATSTDSGVVGYIWGITSEPEAAWTGLMIRQDLLQEQGLELPETIDDWTQCLTVLHEAYGGTLNIPTNGLFPYSDFASAYGVGTGWYQVDGQVHYGVLEEEFKNYLTLLSDWYAAGLIYPDFTSVAFNDLFTLMGQNDGVVALDTLWGFGGANWVERGLTQEEDLFFQGVVHPTLEGGESHISFKSSVRKTSIAVTELADPVLCARFLDYWYTDQGGWEWSLGPQGGSWDYDESGNIDMTEAFDAEVAANLAEGMTTTWENTLRNWACFDIQLGHYHYERLLLQYDDLTIYNATSAVWENDNVDWNYPNEATMTAAEQEVYGRIYTDAETLISEYVCNIIVGNTSVEDGYAALIAALESVNFNACVEAKQAALDRYYDR